MVNWPVAPEQVAQENGLKLDRVLTAVSELGREAILLHARGEPVDEFAVDDGRTERGRIVLASQHERIPHPGVAGAEDHEAVGVAALDEITVGPGVGGSPPVEIDVGGDEPAQGWRSQPAWGARRRRPGPPGAVKKPSSARLSSSGSAG